MPDETDIISKAKKHGLKVAAGGAYTAMVIFCYTHFVTKPEFDKSEARDQATRDMVMVIKGTLKLDSKYE